MKLKRYYFFIVISFFISILFFPEYNYAFLLQNKNNRQESQTKQKKDNTTVKQRNKKNTYSRLKEGTGQSAIWSDAFTFQKAWGSQVDLRTGIFSAWIRTGNLISNMGRGPDIILDINYNSNALANPDGLGQGWSWNLTHFNPLNNQLVTSQGQSFQLYKIDKDHWWSRYHKLKDMYISGSKKKHFVITYANALRETLNHDGYETRLEQQDGRSVDFNYLPGTHLLSSISDNTGHKITLVYQNNYISVTSYSTDGSLVTVYIHYTKGLLYAVSFPVKSTYDYKNININYKGFLLSAITYPTGLVKTVKYNCNNALKLPLFDRQTHALCVVTKINVSPGFGQPEMVTNYTYDHTSFNEHNYLAYNSGLSLLKNSGQDILFDTPASYTYKTTTDNGFVREVHTYNKYHLLIDIKTISDRDSSVLTETQNFFCSTDVTDGCAYTSFNKLPLTYNLPLKITTRTWGDISGRPPSTATVINSYDKKGRLIMTKDSYGREKKITYCPVEGPAMLAGCPEEPNGWSVISRVHSTTIFAPGSDLPSIVKYISYRTLPNINATSYMLVESSEDTYAGLHHIAIKRQYYDDPKNRFTYGLLKKTSFHQNLTANSQHNSVVRYYHYNMNPDHSMKTSYSEVVVDASSDKRLRSPSVSSSLFTNQILSEIDAESKNTTHYFYDFAGRIIRIDLAVGTPFATSKRYDYTSSKYLNQVVITAGNGLKRKILFDGAGRKLKGFDKVISDSGKASNEWRLTYSTAYDNYGHIMAEYDYIFHNISLDEGPGAAYKIIPLETIFDYDHRGRIAVIHLPNGEQAIKKYDDSTRCIVSYNQDTNGHNSPISVIHNNVLGETVQQMLLPAMQNVSVISACTEGDKIPSAQITVTTMDRYNRPISLIDPSGKIVTKRYDALGHLTDIINPAGDKIHNIYNINNQIVKKWLYPVNQNTGYLLFSSGYDAAGRLLWEAGEDGKKTYYTYTLNGQLKTKTTPTGHIVTWEYNVAGLPVQEWLDGKTISQIDYDNKTLLPIKKYDLTGTTTYAYSDDGKVQQIRRFGKNGYPDYHLQWHYNPIRQVTSALDIFGSTVFTRYDKLGRVNNVIYKMKNGYEEQLYTLTYDGFSRINKIYYGSYTQCTKNSVRTISYDTLGRQNDVTDFTEQYNNPLKRNVFLEEKYTYDANNNITQLIQNGRTDQNATLRYQYDRYNNLVAMSCTGSAGLPLCPRDTVLTGSGEKEAPIITSQHYIFTALNRIARVSEQLSDASKHRSLNKVITYTYGNNETPLRLQQISTAWNHQLPINRLFSFDVTGNMIVDGEGNHMTYNVFNQITSVLMPDGRQKKYVYDGSGRKISEISSTSNMSYLFYMNKSLLGEQNGQPGAMHIVSYLGVAKAIDGALHEFYRRNYKGDIITVIKKIPSEKNSDAAIFYALKQYNVYSPYGMQWHKNLTTALPLYQQTLEGFDGARTDPDTGWQFLGAGHRTYNPAQRYFLSEDLAGNGYAFASNNPIMNSDPDGNMPKWMGATLVFLNKFAAFGMNPHSTWGRIGGAIILSSLVLMGSASVIASQVCVGAIIPQLITAETALSIGFAGTCIASAAEPQNKGLNIAAAVIGLAPLAVISVQCVFLAGMMAADLGKMLSSLGEAGAGVAKGIIEMDDLAQEEFNIEKCLETIIPDEIIKTTGIFYKTQVLRIRSNFQLQKLWMRLYALDSLKKAMDDDMLTLLSAAANSSNDINLNLFKQAIASKLRMLTSGFDENNQFSAVFRSIVKTFGRDMTYKYGTNLTDEVFIPDQKALVTGGKNNRTVFLILEDTGNNSPDNFIWSTYKKHKDRVFGVMGPLNMLGLDEFFDKNGQFRINSLQDLAENWFESILS